MQKPKIAGLLLACLTASLILRAPRTQNPNVATYIQTARAKLAAGDLTEARTAIDAALERDEFHLDALAVAAQIAEKQGDKDAAVWLLHRFVDVAARSKETKARAREVADRLAALDPKTGAYKKLTKRYITELLAIAKEHEKHKRMHSALALLAHAKQVDPLDARADAGMRRIRKTGGSDVAVADVYAGGDPTFGKSEAWVTKSNKKHTDWKQAWKLETDNYRYRTNAGYRVLMTSSIAMENVNLFYRRFFHYKEDGGKIAKIEIRIFKSRDEYLELGRNPVRWSAGHFIGDAVETYVGGVSGKESIRRMYGVLFHEAAHHFVSLTSPSCPGWLNEAFASFFEGCEILSNGSVRWNRVPGHRLFPLVARLEKGWMKSPTEGIQEDGTGNPERAPTFRMVVEGHYRWGPPWYAPTWGVVYFLHNYRDDEGRLVYREALHDYYASFRGKQPRDAVGHFETTVLAGKRSPVKTIDALNDIWKKWLFDLRDLQIGRSAKAKTLLAQADSLLAKKDEEGALELLEDAWLAEPDNPDILWRLARLCESRDANDRAAALYRDLASELEQRGLAETDGRYNVARDKALRLDPLVQRYRRLQQKTSSEGLALARDYLARGLPLMAMTIAKQMSGQFAVPEALDLYREIARKTGKTLAHWKLAYNEHSLEGWSADGANRYAAYGREIRAHVEPGPERKRKDEFTTCALTCDVAFAGDFSLETEIWIEEGKVKLAGLCFGLKDTTNFLALLLHPKGYLDLAANHGGAWETLDHRQVELARGWHKLRADVAGKNLDFYLDGLWVRTFEFPNDAVLRGGFGLLTGEGNTSYRGIRLLARDPHDPAARIERELAMAKIREDASLRTGNTFSGFRAPELDAGRWAHGTPIRLAQPGTPTLLLFWTKSQERQMPTMAYARHVATTLGRLGLRVVVVAGDRISESSLRRSLGKSPPPSLWGVCDPKGKLFAKYGIREGGFGLPRAVLIDVDTKVIFEGDLGVRLGQGWQEDTPTYLDDPLAKLVATRKLEQLAKLAPTLGQARRLLRESKLAAALALLQPLAALPVPGHPAVAEARQALARQKRVAVAIVAGAAKLARDYPLRTAARLEAIAEAFAADKEMATKARKLARTVKKSSAWRRSKATLALIDKARNLRALGKAAAADRMLERARKAAKTAELHEAIERAAGSKIGG